MLLRWMDVKLNTERTILHKICLNYFFFLNASFTRSKCVCVWHAETNEQEQRNYLQLKQKGTIQMLLVLVGQHLR